MFMDVLVHIDRFDMSIYKRSGLICVYTDRFTRVCYNVYQGIHMSICGKPSPNRFTDVLVHTNRFQICIYGQIWYVYIQTGLPMSVIVFTRVYFCAYVCARNPLCRENTDLPMSLTRNTRVNAVMFSSKPWLVRYVEVHHLQTCMTGQKFQIHDESPSQKQSTTFSNSVYRGKHIYISG